MTSAAPSSTAATSGTSETTASRGRVGDSPLRPDGTLKVTGEFAYASDLSCEDMLWGATLRSPHPHARIVAIDTAPALAVPGVHVPPDRDQPVVVLAPALGARPVPCRERCRLVEEEELRVAAGLQQ